MSYTKYSLQDLGTSISPWNLNNNRDVVGWQPTATGSVPSIHLADGTVITVPAEIVVTTQINDSGLVLGSVESGQSVLFDTTTQLMEAIEIPGFSHVDAGAINDNGDIAGTAGRGPSVLDDWRGFILNRNTKAVTWVFPAIAPLPPGATPFLALSDLNNLGHAVGTQGWERGLDQLEEPVFYNGNVVTSIGAPVFIAGTSRITNNDLMRVSYHPGNGRDSEAIYDGQANTLTAFTDRRIIDINSSGDVLWESLPFGSEIYLSTASGTTKLDDLFPAGSGWTPTAASGMNDHGDIIGIGALSGEQHGYMLRADYRIEHVDMAVARILWGIINDAGGSELIGIILHRVPPYGPLRELLEALPRAMRQEVVTAMNEARFDSRSSVQAFSSRVRGVVARYRSQSQPLR